MKWEFLEQIIPQQLYLNQIAAGFHQKPLVFDEEYVDKTVKLHEEHLDTIVILGEQVDLTEQIEKAEGECSAAKVALETKQCSFAAGIKNFLSL